MSLKIDKLDWKFATATMLAIIAIVSPFLLWKADLDAKKIDMTLLGRYYERCADHAVSIARRVYFLVKGEYHEHCH